MGLKEKLNKDKKATKRKSKYSGGYEILAEEKRKREEEGRKRQEKLYDFFITNDKEEADIIFLTEDPLTPLVHTVQEYANGKSFFNKYVCLEENCDICESTNDRPTRMGVYLVVDRREYDYTDPKTNKKKKGSDQIKLYYVGSRVASQLERLSNKYGLLNREVTVTRLGSGTSTTYSFDRGEVLDLDVDDIESLMPEWLCNQWDGTFDGLYELIDNQLDKIRADEHDKEDIDEDDEIISVDDEDEDEKPSRLKRTIASKSSKKTKSLKPLGKTSKKKKSKSKVIELPF